MSNSKVKTILVSQPDPKVENSSPSKTEIKRHGPPPWHNELLIADLHMKGMDGFSMLRVVAADTQSQGTTIVVVTGLNPGAIADQGGVPQGIEVLPKPVPFARLLEIASAIEQTSRA